MEHKRKDRRNVNVLLLILAGFCLLAIMEILYGQARMRVERKRLAEEEQNRQMVEELSRELAQLREAKAAQQTEQMEQTGQTEQAPAAAGEGQTSAGAAQQTAGKEQALQTAGKAESARRYSMQVVILGDNIMDKDRSERGAAAIIGEQLNAKVYNMSMGGTTAALLPDEQNNLKNWKSRSLVGVVNGILGNIDTDLFDGYGAEAAFKNCNFEETDYFVIEYGINDFLAEKIPNSRYLEGGGELPIDSLHTYTGALEYAVSKLKERFPDAGILVIAPHYSQVFSGKTFIGDGYSIDYGYGPLITFARGAGYVAEQHRDQRVFFYNAFEESGISAGTAEDYLSDGIHMTPLGARVYAEKAASFIWADFASD